MTALITSDDYPAVRAALSLAFADDTDLLPDALIGMDLFQGRAEDDVLAIDPDAEIRTGAEETRVKRAVVLLVAAYLAPSIPSIVRERRLDFEYQLAPVDWAAKAVQLRAQAIAELDALVEVEAPVEPFSIFTTASAGRLG